MRHLRRDRREHARQDGRAGRGDHRQPVRGGGLPEPRHADQGQHADARGPAARRAQPVLQGAAGGVAASPGQALGAAQDRAARRAATPADCIVVPEEALYYACLGCVEIGAGRARGRRRLPGTRQAALVDRRGPARAEGQGRRQGPGLLRRATSSAFVAEYDLKRPGASAPPAEVAHVHAGPVLVGCDFGSTTAKAVVLSPERELLFTCYALSQGQSRSRTPSRCSGRCGEAGFSEVGGARADRLRQGPAEGRARRRHRRGGDGGARHRGAALLPGRRRDLRRGRHRRQDHDPAPGHGRRLPPELAVLVRATAPSCRAWPSATSIPLEDYADRAFEAKAMPTPGHGLRRVPPVRHRQPAAQGLVGRGDHGRAGRGAAASTCGSTPASCRISRAAGRKFVLQGGTHRNMAVVKAQVDFIRGKVPDAEVVLHPYSGEAGAIGAALCAARLARRRPRAPLPRLRRHRGARPTRARPAAETVCKWCPVNCTRTFIDVQLPGAQGPRRGASCRSPRAGSG